MVAELTRRLFVLSGGAALVAGPAEAAPRLVGQFVSPMRLELRFSQWIVPGTIEVTIRDGEGVEAPLRIGQSGDMKRVTVVPSPRLRRGRYRVDWAVSGRRGPPVSGAFVLTVTS